MLCDEEKKARRKSGKGRKRAASTGRAGAAVRQKDKELEELRVKCKGANVGERQHGSPKESF